MSGNDAVTRVAEAVADGVPVAWDAAVSDAADADRPLLECLRGIEELAARSRSISASLSHAGDEQRPLPHVAPVPSCWAHLRILERVGSGTFGDVVRAWDERLHREVALKLQRRQTPAGDLMVREGRLLAKVHHPNVVTVYGAEVAGERGGVWMEFVRGRTLERILLDHGPFGDEELAAIGRSLCGALAAVHAAGLVHRDVKAQNVVREDGGRIVLMDLGSGISRSPSEDEAGSGLAGTPLYLAPEVLTGGAATTQSDIYSLGVLLWHLATGSYPVNGRTFEDVKRAHQTGVRQRLRDARPDLPGGLVSAIERACAPPPGERYATAGEFEAALHPDRFSVDRAPGAAAAPTVTWPTSVIGRVALAGGVIAVVAMTVAAIWWARAGSAPRVPFAPRDYLLVAEFANRTGDGTLDGALETALTRELSVSRVVNVVPRERVLDALRLMRQPADARLTLPVAREVCQRDGGIRVLLAGGVQRAGDKFVVEASLIDPVDGQTQAYLTERAATTGDLLTAVGRLAGKVRAALGDDGSKRDERPQELAHVTTSSMKALQLYSQAVELGTRSAWLMRPQWEASAALAEEALRFDPDFAAAHAWLAKCLWSQLRRTEALPHFARARELTGAVSERERLAIEAGYAHAAGNDAKAIAMWEALTVLYPDDFWGTSNLAETYHEQDRPEAFAWMMRRADLRPNDFKIRTDALAASLRQGTLERTGELAQQAWTLLPDDRESVAATVAWLSFEPIFERWLAQDVAGVVTGIDRRETASQAAGLTEQRFVQQQAAWMNLSLGRLAAADASNQRGFGSLLVSAQIARLRGNRSMVRQRALEYVRGANGANRFWVPALLLADSGFVADAEAVLAEAAASAQSPLWQRRSLEIAQAAVALARGRHDRVRAILSAGNACVTSPGSFEWSWCQKLSAAADEDRGDRAAAIARLERATARRPAFFSLTNAPSWGCLWVELRAALMTLYRQDGRDQDADTLAAELRHLLASADADFDVAGFR